MAENKYPSVAFRLIDSLAKQILERAEGDSASDMNAIARRDLQRYYTAINRDQRILASMFSRPQLNLICDALSGVPLDPFIPGAIRHEIESAIKLRRLDIKWKVKVPNFIETLSNLSTGQEVALVDAVERFWQRYKGGEKELALSEVLAPIKVSWGNKVK